jgi:hypothetical protein
VNVASGPVLPACAGHGRQAETGRSGLDCSDAPAPAGLLKALSLSKGKPGLLGPTPILRFGRCSEQTCQGRLSLSTRVPGSPTANPRRRTGASGAELVA